MKDKTQSVYFECMNRVVDYIDIHLQNRITIGELADVANMSECHFHRIFKAFIGEPVGAYIVRLRLEQIAQRLQLNTLNIEQIANRTGYKSKHSLSKAFKKQFGLSPSTFRQGHKTNVKQVIGSDEFDNLNPIIQQVAAKNLIYIRIIGEYGEAEPYAEAWRKLLAFAEQNNLITADNEYIGISFDSPEITETHKCRFYACLTVDRNIIPQGEFGTKTIEAGLFAVFTLKGACSKLNVLYNAIFYKWLPDSGYKLRNNLLYEKYMDDTNVEEENWWTEIYIPVE